jgi:endoglucanase
MMNSWASWSGNNYSVKGSLMNLKKKSSWQPPQIGATQVRILKRLSNACGVSGNEEQIRNLVLKEIKPLTNEISIDPLGNVLAIKRGRGKNLPRVMLAAHMDEVGFMLTHSEGNGFFRFEIVGGIDPRHLVGKPVIVGDKQSPGIIGTKPIHMTTAGEREKIIKVDALRVDMGPGMENEAKVGNWGTFATKFSRNGQSLLGKAFDDRLGVATLIELIKNSPKNIDLFAAFTVQEEIGLRGARVAAYKMDPDMAMVLDCTPSMDMPMWDDNDNTMYRTKIGMGPAIYVGDRATISDPRLVKHLTRVGDLYGIPYQIRQPGGGGTDAGAIHLQRQGIPSVSVSVPCRYIHTSISLIRMADWRNYIALLHAALSHINKNSLQNPR